MEKFKIIEQYFDRVNINGEPQFKRKYDGRLFSQQQMSVYGPEILEEIGQCIKTPEFLVD